MLLTRAGEYALLALVELSKVDIPQDADSLANKLKLSRSFLAKILQTLAKNGILRSFKGARGGFLLAKGLDEISIKEVLDIVEAKGVIVFDCSSDGICPDGIENCAILSVLNNLQKRIDEFLSTLTLKDICFNEGTFS